MVARLPTRPRRDDAHLDRLFRALADRTRRDIVARVLSGEEASVSTLAARYTMSFAAVQKHVAVLAQAGLVSKRTRGRERMVRGNPKELARARTLLTQLEQLWISRFSQLIVKPWPSCLVRSKPSGASARIAARWARSPR